MRNPINHPAVMYKKSIVEQAGGYKKMMWFGLEWCKVLQYSRTTCKYGQLERRGGLKYAIEEFK